LQEEINQTPINGVARDYWPIEYDLVNGTSREELWNEVVQKWHYLGYKMMIGPRVKYLLWHNGRLIGAISFNQAMLKLKPRDQLTGALQGDFRQHILPHIINNNRFLIFPWIRIRNLASKILSNIMPRVRADWESRYGITPYAVETFVDLAQYKGTCYKAANWKLIGETRGYKKVGKEMIYHGNRKGIFFIIIDKKRFERLVSRYRTYPAPGTKPEWESVRAEETVMVDRLPIWDPDLFAIAQMAKEHVENLANFFMKFMDHFIACYRRNGQQHNAELFIKGLLSDVGGRKNIENIALALEGSNRVRTLQNFIKDAPWRHNVMRDIYQRIIFDSYNAPDGMITLDDSGVKKDGKNSFGVAHQYLGNLGKTANCQVGVYVGYCSPKGHGLLDARLYVPKTWFEDPAKLQLWKRSDAPETLTFRTKPEIATDLVNEILERNHFSFKWIGFDSGYSSKELRLQLPDDKWYFGDVRNNHLIIPVETYVPVHAKDVAEDDSVKWHRIEKFMGSNGPVEYWYKAIRVTEPNDETELWLYIRKNKNNDIRYALSNAPGTLEMIELNLAGEMRWSIESSFKECKTNLGLDEYETRSYQGWHRHMLLVMVAHQFVNQVRDLFTVPYEKPRNGKGINSGRIIHKIPAGTQIIMTSKEKSTNEQLTIRPNEYSQLGEKLISNIINIRFLSFNQAAYLIKASISGNSKNINKAMDTIAHDLKGTWNSLMSRTRKFLRDNYSQPGFSASRLIPLRL